MLTLGFVGSGAFAARCLEIISRDVRPLWVVTGAPKAAGRGMAEKPTRVFEKARELSLPVYTTQKLSRDERLVETMKESRPDAIAVVDFGQMIKEPVLSLAPLGCLNVHPSKLPEYRGSAPIQRALMDGKTETAVSIFRLDAGMDSGDILAQPTLQIEPADTAETLLEKAALLGSETLLYYLTATPRGEWRFTKQDERAATYAPKIEKSEGKIDWGKESAEKIINKIRGMGGSPGVFCTIRGKRLRIREAVACEAQSAKEAGVCEIKDGVPTIACEEGSVILVTVQQEGKKSQSAADWARGARIESGTRFE